LLSESSEFVLLTIRQGHRVHIQVRHKVDDTARRQFVQGVNVSSKYAQKIPDCARTVLFRTNTGLRLWEYNSVQWRS
jgi:hypothetical protein